jgi:hypothetical protein
MQALALALTRTIKSQSIFRSATTKAVISAKNVFAWAIVYLPAAKSNVASSESALSNQS